MRIFAIPFEEISCTRDLKRKSEGLFIGVWRSWLAHLVWDQRVLCSSHSTPTYKRLSVWMTSFFVYGPVCLAQRKIPVDLHFIVRLRHKASGAALGLSCAVCFEQPAGVFAGCGAVCQAKILASLKIKNGISLTPLN